MARMASLKGRFLDLQSMIRRTLSFSSERDRLGLHCFAGPMLTVEAFPSAFTSNRSLTPAPPSLCG